MTFTETALTVMMGVMSLIATGAVPWAYVMERRLARIEVIITNGMRSEIAELKTTSQLLFNKVVELEKQCAILRALPPAKMP